MKEHVYFWVGCSLVVGVELARWLADMPAETATAISLFATTTLLASHREGVKKQRELEGGE